MATEIIFVFT